MKPSLLFSFLLIFMLGFSGASQSAPLCESLFTSKKISSSSEITWEFSRQTLQALNQTWLNQPLKEAIQSLPLTKKIRLKLLLRSYNPTTDFLFFRHSERFLTELTDIFEGKVNLSGLRNLENNEGLQQLVQKYQHRQDGAKALSAQARSYAPEKPSLYDRLRIFTSRLKTRPWFDLLKFPARLPYWYKKPVPENILKSLAERDWIQKMTTMEENVSRGLVHHEYFKQLRKAGNIVLFGVMAITTYHHSETILQGDKDQINSAAETAYVEYVEKKESELNEAKDELAAYNELLELMKDNPELYVETYVIPQFREVYDREPKDAEIHFLIDSIITQNLMESSLVPPE